MPIFVGGGTTQHLKRTMVFIDGGNFRKFLEDALGSGFVKNPDKISQGLQILLSDILSTLNASVYHHEIIRVYYYDGIFSPTEPEYNELTQFFKAIKNNFPKNFPFEMKFGRLIKTPKNREPIRQKGVDVLLSVDIVAKAFLDHYDEAVIVAGDDDFLDAVISVKDFTGKKVIGFYSLKGASERLIDSFDLKYELDKVKFAEKIQKMGK